MSTKLIAILFCFFVVMSSIALSQDSRERQFDSMSETFYRSTKLIKIQTVLGEDTLTFSDTIAATNGISIDPGAKEIRISSLHFKDNKRYIIVRTELENDQKHYICKIWNADLEYRIWISKDEDELIIVEGQNKLVYLLEPDVEKSGIPY